MTAEQLLERALAAARASASPRIYRMLAPVAAVVRLEPTDDVPTARISLRGPGAYRLQVSPGFVRRFVRTDADALFLLLHEMLHRVRGDFGRETSALPLSPEAVNLVLDVAVNAALLRLAFPHPPPLLVRLYPPDRFPGNLLLPPNAMARACRARDARWEPFDRPHEELRRLCTGSGLALAVLRTLVEGVLRGSGAPSPRGLADFYLSGWLGSMSTGLFLREATRLLAREFPSVRALLARVTFLGDHAGDVLFERLRSLLRATGPGVGSSVREIRIGAVETADERALFEAVSRAVCRDDGRPRPREAASAAADVVEQVGRREVLFLAAGVAPPFYRQAMSAPDDESERVHLYLDVSGSTSDWQRLFCGLTLRLGSRIGSPVYLFSNEVSAATMEDLAEGVCRTTGGTDFDCVWTHALDRGFSRIVLVTDGMARLSGELSARGRARGLRVCAVLTSDCGGCTSPLAEVVEDWWMLPSTLRRC